MKYSFSPDFYQQVKNELLEYGFNHQLSLKGLAKKTDLSYSTLYKICTVENPTPTDKTLSVLQDTLALPCLAQLDFSDLKNQVKKRPKRLSFYGTNEEYAVFKKVRLVQRYNKAKYDEWLAWNQDFLGLNN